MNEKYKYIAVVKSPYNDKLYPFELSHDIACKSDDIKYFKKLKDAKKYKARVAIKHEILLYRKIK